MEEKIAQRVLIMGAAGRDFHNFNLFFRDNEDYQVVAFTATQIPDIEGRLYPAQLAGSLYPEGIAIHPEEELEALIEDLQVDQVVFAYSDISHTFVMHQASRVLATGADFCLMGGDKTMLESQKPVIAICAVRTGSGKSQTTRRVCDILRDQGKKVVVVRHPMPYGNLAEQAVQRFASHEDLDRHDCTIEEREEYEPHLDRGIVVYAGVDYEAILRQAEKESDIVVWDGGNNDLPFFRPSLHIVVVDPHRPGHSVRYHPGETNLRMADVVVINKIDTAGLDNVAQVRNTVREVNPEAIIVDAASPIFVENPQEILGKRVLVVEDGPTLTHGEMSYGAGVVAARRFGAAEIIDPKPYAVRSIAATYDKYPTTGAVLPAMGYGDQQIADLSETIANVPCDLVIIATPIDLTKVARIDKPHQRVRYELQEIGKPDLVDILGSRFGTSS
ncbi:MAG: cyclic 2,3-diphosphoglycerate synthase [Chloroflexota bacterium]|nr:cyclic 2,3-diphosphoglycerate synthase [Chloroflexota bacterium]